MRCPIPIGQQRHSPRIGQRHLVYLQCFLCVSVCLCLCSKYLRVIVGESVCVHYGSIGDVCWVFVNFLKASFFHHVQQSQSDLFITHQVTVNLVWMARPSLERTRGVECCGWCSKLSSTNSNYFAPCMWPLQSVRSFTSDVGWSEAMNTVNTNLRL